MIEWTIFLIIAFFVVASFFYRLGKLKERNGDERIEQSLNETMRIYSMGGVGMPDAAIEAMEKYQLNKREAKWMLAQLASLMNKAGMSASNAAELTASIYRLYVSSRTF
jgi:hypothetical protein